MSARKWSENDCQTKVIPDQFNKDFDELAKAEDDIVINGHIIESIMFDDHIAIDQFKPFPKDYTIAALEYIVYLGNNYVYQNLL